MFSPHLNWDDLWPCANFSVYVCQGKNVVIDDENWYIATRQSYTSLIKQKVIYKRECASLSLGPSGGRGCSSKLTGCIASWL